MASFIDVNSLYRDYATHPNPADFTVHGDDQIGWFLTNRRVSSNSKNPAMLSSGFATSIKLESITIPYSDDFAILQRIYVEFRSNTTIGSTGLIQTMQNKVPDAMFACVLDKIQNDSDGNPVWLVWKGINDQVMRWDKNKDINFKIMTPTGSTLDIQDTDPPDPANQVIAFFRFEPYSIDADYRDEETQAKPT